MNLRQLISQGESETLEFKQTFDKETIETVCAFANAKGGKLLIGVTDEGELKGVQISDETIQQYINQIKTQTEPGLVVDIESHPRLPNHDLSIRRKWRWLYGDYRLHSAKTKYRNG